MRNGVLRTVLISLTLLNAYRAFCQQQPPSDPQAVSLAAQSISAMTSGTILTDVSLSGNATWLSGSQQGSGQAIFLAKGTTESRTDLIGSGGTRTDTRNIAGTVREGQWTGWDGNTQLYAMHNCMTDAAWFFPSLSSLSNADPALVWKYIGMENRNGSSVQHIQVYRYAYNKSPATMALFQQFSTIEFYLDAASLLPLATTFNVHPDDDASTNIPAEVDFLGYQSISGILVPAHIQEYLAGALTLDFVTTSAAVNSGLPDSDFMIHE